MNGVIKKEEGLLRACTGQRASVGGIDVLGWERTSETKQLGKAGKAFLICHILVFPEGSFNLNIIHDAVLMFISNLSSFRKYM